jgi:hypothetical protein
MATGTEQRLVMSMCDQLGSNPGLLSDTRLCEPAELKHWHTVEELKYSCVRQDKNGGGVMLPCGPGSPGLPGIPTPFSPLCPVSPFIPASPTEKRKAFPFTCCTLTV